MFRFKFTTAVMLAAALAFASCSDSGSSSGGGGGTKPLTDSESVTADVAALDCDDIIFAGADTPTNVTGNFFLPVSGGNGTIISWESDNGLVVIGLNGAVAITRPAFGSGSATVTLTASVTKNGVSETKNITITVIEVPQTDAEAVIADAALLDSGDFTYSPGDSSSNVTKNFTMSTAGACGTTITWAEKTDAGNNIVLSGTGNSSSAVTWPEASGFGPYSVTLTATITKGTESTTKDISVTVIPPATTKISTTVDSVTFKMVLVPGGMTFPTGVNDDGTDTVANAYWIEETEVTYEMWNKVYTWATNAARGANIYYFANTGTMGDGTGDTNQHPVTTVSWRDSMVWCNALTEWYNAQKGTIYACVYTSDVAYGIPIRDSRDGSYGSSINATAGSFDNPYINPNAKGFRLLTSSEYELAARYRNGTLWTYGDHASGDDSGACSNDGGILGGLGMSTVFGNYAVYSSNSGASTAVVKSKTNGYNALGLYDMSGNVWEWCFTASGSDRVLRGGGWYNAALYLQVGYWILYAPSFEYNRGGFRYARTQ